jgi:hypothetical protein
MVKDDFLVRTHEMFHLHGHPCGDPVDDIREVVGAPVPEPRERQPQLGDVVELSKLLQSADSGDECRETIICEGGFTQEVELALLESVLHGSVDRMLLCARQWCVTCAAALRDVAWAAFLRYSADCDVGVLGD